MDSHQLIKQVEAEAAKKAVADIRVGETVKVDYKIREGGKERVQSFQGLVIAAKGGTSLQSSFTVRKVVDGIGVERTFPLHSPWIVKIERLKSGKVRRAKLYFVRRHAQSPKRFKLKDKGVEGTIWQEVAEQQQEIAAEQAEAKELETTSSEQETVEAAKVETDDTAATESQADQTEAGDRAAEKQETDSSEPKSSD